jgi:mono/diheme cytochrome c family protein
MRPDHARSGQGVITRGRGGVRLRRTRKAGGTVDITVKTPALAAVAVVVALAAGGCDRGDACVSPNTAGAHGVSPYNASAPTADWPDEVAGDEALVGDLADGRQLYLGTCAACHGAAGQGLPNQGTDLRGSAFVTDSSDDALQSFLAAGRPASDPNNTSGLPMPPRGGNLSLSDWHLGLIVKFLRTLRPERDGDVLGSAAEAATVEGQR